METLYYICPHLSTGGQPQYTLKMIQTFYKQFNIEVIEANNYSNEYTVQRDLIKKLVKVHQLNGDLNFLSVLKDKKFNEETILHFQELPESFIDDYILKNLYDFNRKYKIVVTTHSSLTKPSNFKYIPDRIIAVNEWQKNALNELTDADIWEYPIENKYKPYSEKEKYFEKLEKKYELLSLCNKLPKNIHKATQLHKEKLLNDITCVLNVGLFTPGKNQGELFEIAKRNPTTVYHFVGNQALNFKDYWGPLMENKPDNCIIWGERNNLDLFYKGCDLFYFASIFELNPIVIKEALSYELPVMMRRLETYGDSYDHNELVTYID